MKLSLFVIAAAACFGQTAAAPLNQSESGAAHPRALSKRASTNSVGLFQAPCIFSANYAGQLKSSNYRDQCKTFGMWDNGYYIADANGNLNYGMIPILGQNNIMSFTPGQSNLRAPGNSRVSCDHIYEADQLLRYVKQNVGNIQELSSLCSSSMPAANDKDREKKIAVAEANLAFFKILNGKGNMQTVSQVINGDKNKVVSGTALLQDKRRYVAVKNYMTTVTRNYELTTARLGLVFDKLNKKVPVKPKQDFLEFSAKEFCVCRINHILQA